MITYNWITKYLFTIDTQTETNYVVDVVYTVEGQDENLVTAAIENKTTFAVIQDEPDYIPYDQLTNDIVIGWIQAQLGPDGILSIENAIAGMIQSQINPPPSPELKPLPF